MRKLISAILVICFACVIKAQGEAEGEWFNPDGFLFDDLDRCTAHDLLDWQLEGSLDTIKALTETLANPKDIMAEYVHFSQKIWENTPFCIELVSATINMMQAYSHYVLSSVISLVDPELAAAKEQEALFVERLENGAVMWNNLHDLQREMLSD